MKIFKVQENLKSYKYPIIKIVISVMILVVLMNRGSFESKLLNVIVTFISFQICILSALCVYVSIIEIMELYWTRKERKLSFTISDSVQMPVNVVLDMISDNDIIEILVLVDKSALKIGSCADYKLSDDKFFDKRFYIADEEYALLEDFKIELIKLTTDGLINVISIDGVSSK